MLMIAMMMITMLMMMVMMLKMIPEDGEDNNNRWQWGLASPRKQLVYSEATCTLNTCVEHSRKAQSQRQRLENQLLKPEAKGCPTLCVET